MVLDSRRTTNRSLSGRFAVRAIYLVVFQTILELAEGFIDGLDGFHAVPAKIMRGVFQMVLGPSKRVDRFADFGVRFRQRCGRGRRLRSCCRNCGGSGRFGRCWSGGHRQTQRQCKNHQGGKTQDFQFHFSLHDVQDFLAGSRIARRRIHSSPDRQSGINGSETFVASVNNGSSCGCSHRHLSRRVACGRLIANRASRFSPSIFSFHRGAISIIVGVRIGR